MLKYLMAICLFLSFLTVQAQVTGHVTNDDGNPLPFVNIYTEAGSNGTTTNNEGYYELKVPRPGNYTLVFQYLGYKTLKKPVSVHSSPVNLDIVLKQESTGLDEIVLENNADPAIRVIQNAIQHRKINAEKLESFTASFYSRGLWRIKNAPEKFLGQEIGDLGGGLDSTRSGIVYLSETISNIALQKPDDFKEHIIASKVSGNDNGFSLNSAQEAYFSFYENTVEVNSELVSPIADYAFNYYRYKLEGTFYDDRGNLINKIKVTPKREEDRIFSGYIYIVEDLWQIYGIELTATGKAIQVPPIEKLLFKQNYRFFEEPGRYVQISQSVDFSFKMFGFGGDGRFTAVYSDYNFQPEFNKRSFGKEILSFSEKANKKDSVFWNEVRPVPLTGEELGDYIKKDQIQEHRNSRKYKDSIDAVQNKFEVSDILFGYTYQNSWKNQRFSLSAPLRGIDFNTVQGWNSSLELSYLKRTGENQENYWSLSSMVNYGFEEDRLRVSAEFEKKFNNFDKDFLRISGGTKIAQLNTNSPLSPFLNSITTVLFERNYMKLFDKSFVTAGYGKDIIPGIRVYGELGWENRKPLINNTDHVFIDYDDRIYSSNNPLQPQVWGSKAFEEHSLVKSNFTVDISFDQKYLSYPDGRYNVYENKYPKLRLGWEKGFGSSDPKYNYDQFKAQIRQNLKLGNKGEFNYTLRGGLFSNAEEISLIDYQHFNANQIQIAFGSYVGSFNLMPYYEFSTNQNYAEFHAEHDFQGWVLGKLPLINKLNYNLILGAHRLTTFERNPYSEYSIGVDNLGFGKFRFLRLDYVISTYNGKKDGAFVFGLKF
ncbi:DUF5686 and carboxypeptidase regulatory-like domain-containing protein [Christiangramia aquimixticola]|uniref:DUF5686 and carboxypeptidase regulatory-like domain-containing protein n=1 Tax=Christiangramia aquimixticola TaxID=1697558 RepID=UPI003AA86568